MSSVATAPDQEPTGTPEGQGEGAVPQGQAEEFYSYTSPDGNTLSAKTREDLDNHLKKSYFFQKDYTRKTQELSELRKRLEKQQMDFDEQQKTFVKSRQQYDEWDRLLKSRPELYQQLTRMAQQPSSPGEVFDRSKSYADEQIEALKAEIEAMKSERQQEKNQQEWQQGIAKLREEYPDFDEEAVSGIVEELSSGSLEPLFRMAYFANRGMKNPAQVEQEIASKIEKKRSAGMARSGGTTPSKKAEFKNMDEAYQAAMQEYGRS